MSFEIRALLAGKAQPLARGEWSAIDKRPLSGRVRIGLVGIEGDEQADKAHHGGRDKALHHYPYDHYVRWRLSSDLAPLLSGPGAFGENLSTEGLTEESVCIGDLWRFGSVLVEVSQGREPCWKQGDRLGWPALPQMMVRERRSGWYYRVKEAGEAEAGDALVLVDRPLPDWSVRRVFSLLIGGDYHNDPSALCELAAMAPLFDGWRARAKKLMGG